MNMPKSVSGLNVVQVHFCERVNMVCLCECEMLVKSGSIVFYFGEEKINVGRNFDIRIDESVTHSNKMK